MSVPKIIRSFIIFAALIAIASTPSEAMQWCGSCPQGPYRYVTTESSYPYAEDIIDEALESPISVGNTWTTVNAGCYYGKNLDAGSAVNVLLRAYLRMNSSTAAAGTQYEVRFNRKAVGSETILETYGWYIRTVKDYYPQGEHFHSTIRNLPPTPADSDPTNNYDWRIELQVRVLDAGRSVVFNQRYMTLQGAPSDGTSPGVATRFPSDAAVFLDPAVITGSWSSTLFPTLNFQNTVPVDIYVQAYMEVNSGVANDQISVGFQLDNEPSSRRTSNFAVPNGYGSSLREGINIVDHIENVPADLHTLKLWVINRNGQPTTVRFRQIEFVSFPAEASHPMQPPFGQLNTLTNTVRVDSRIAPPPQQPSAPGPDSHGTWYNLGEFDLPARAGEFNWVGEGYIELLGRARDAYGNYIGTWETAQAQIAVEVLDPNGTAATDMHWVQVGVPDKRGQIYFYMDAFKWGNNFQHGGFNGNRVRLWIRKAMGQSSPGVFLGDGVFDVGRRYMSMKLVPVGDDTGCYFSPNP